MKGVCCFCFYRTSYKNQMKNKKIIIPLVITGLNIFTYLVPVIILFPLLALLSLLDGGILTLIGTLLFIFLLFLDLIMMCLAPITQVILAIMAIVNRKWWLLLVHVPFIAMTLGGSYVFLDWFSSINV